MIRLSSIERFQSLQTFFNTIIERIQNLQTNLNNAANDLDSIYSGSYTDTINAKVNF